MKALQTFIAVATLISSAAAARADLVTLDRKPEQGALVRGTTTPGTKVTLDGQPVRVAPDGHFILGFGRDATGSATIHVSLPDGPQQELTIGIAARQYDIRRIDGLPEQQVTPDAETLARIRNDAALVTKARATDSDALFFEKPLTWPAEGPISGVYGSQSILNGEPRAPHFGVDVATPPGTPVKAADAGTVTLAERDLYLTGGTIVIDHGYGLSTTYMHMSSVDVSVGQAVAQGDIIGKVGATGRVTGPHLDWRVNWYQTRLDPQLVAGPMPPLETPPAK